MVSILHGGENIAKLDEILKEAKRRFGLYGFERTTMKEIAGGFSMSKASLYYYFPDKESLFRAVIEREQDQFFRLLLQKLEKLDSAEEMLTLFIRLRHQHFRKFVSLNIFRYSNVEKIRPHISATFLKFRERETEVIRSFLSRGVKTHEFRCRDPKTTAALFLDVLHGIRLVVMNFRDYSELRQKDYASIELKHLQFLELFLKSLKNTLK